MTEYFKGYVPTTNKKCSMSFKDKGTEELMSLSEAQHHDEYAGVLAENIVLLDVDNFDQSEILFRMVQDLELKCRVYETTRGKHFLFKNNGVEKGGVNSPLAVGLRADIKTDKNSYAILRFGCKDREILYDCDEPQPLPKWLLPLKKEEVKVDFTTMKEGDGRNQELFNYILTLQKAKFTTRSARECIRLLNKYVLKEPLPNDELEVILRDEAFQKTIFFKGNTFLISNFAEALKNNCNVIRIDGQLHLYQNGIYVTGRDNIEAEMKRMYPEITKNKRNEVYDHLELTIRDETPLMGPNLIPFRNGVYDLDTDSLLPFSPDYIVTHRIPWDYNPDAKSDLVDTVLNNVSCNDKQIRSLLEEMAGYCFYRDNKFGKAFILTGEKENGKSTYLGMVRTMLGKENTCALDLVGLEGRFKNAEIYGKLANIGDDIGDEYIPSTAFFKKLVTGEEVTAERKGERPFAFSSYATLLFSANNIPRLGKGRDWAALKRRLIIIPFDAKFNQDDPDFNLDIKKMICEQAAIEYLIKLSIEGLKRVLFNDGFTKCGKVDKALDEYEEITNPTIGFFKELEYEDVKVLYEINTNIYNLYDGYCRRNGFQAINNKVFSKELIKYFDCATLAKKIDGRKRTIYVPKNYSKGVKK